MNGVIKLNKNAQRLSLLLCVHAQLKSLWQQIFTAFCAGSNREFQNPHGAQIPGPSQRTINPRTVLDSNVQISCDLDFHVQISRYLGLPRGPHIFDYLSQQSVWKRSKIEYLIRFEIGERDWRTRLQNEIAERPIVNPNAIGCTKTASI